MRKLIATPQNTLVQITRVWKCVWSFQTWRWKIIHSLKMFWWRSHEMYLLPATDKTMSDQVYILISDLPIYEPLVQWYDHRKWLGRPRFDSWRGQFFDIWNFQFLWHFHMFRVYIDTFELKISQPPWFGGCRRWINDLAVVGSIPCRQNCGTWSTPWGELKWARLGQWSS